MAQLEPIVVSKIPAQLSVRGARSGNVVISNIIEPIVIRYGEKLVVTKAVKEIEAGHRAQDGNRVSDKAITGLPYAERIVPQDNSWLLGTPVIDFLALEFNAYIDDQGNSVPAGGVLIQNIILTVTNRKNIVKTTIPGHRGTVKQFISDGDFMIQGVGKIVAPPEGFTGSYTFEGGNKITPQGEFKMGQRPTDEIMQLIRVLRAQVEVNVYSPFLNLFDIDRCIITSYEFPQETGKLDNQLFRFTMDSDEDFEVIINK